MSKLRCTGSPEHCFYLSKQCKPNIMPHSAAFQLGLHCLPKYYLSGFQHVEVNPLFSFQVLTRYLIETPFNTFANRSDPYQAALVRAAWSGSTLFAYGNMIRYDTSLVDLTSNFFVLCINVRVYSHNY